MTLQQAQLELARTEVRASADGTITNLDVRVGDYAAAGQARMALVASEGMWVYGYFEETKLPGIRIGAPAEVILMSGSEPLQGKVQSISRGITDRNAAELLRGTQIYIDRASMPETERRSAS